MRKKLTPLFPVACHIRLLSSGKIISEKDAESLEATVDWPGVYRVEGWLDVAGERPVALFQSDLRAMRAIETLAIRP